MKRTVFPLACLNLKLFKEEKNLEQQPFCNRFLIFHSVLQKTNNKLNAYSDLRPSRNAAVCSVRAEI